jgi:hypothetical protein
LVPNIPLVSGKGGGELNQFVAIWLRCQEPKCPVVYKVIEPDIPGKTMPLADPACGHPY